MKFTQDSETSRVATGDGKDKATTFAPQTEMTMVTKLYRHDCRFECCPSRWAEYAVVQDEQNALTKTLSEIPIIHRHTYKDKEWITDSFTIQSSALKDLFKKVLDKYQDLDMELENWTFRPPYRPLVHRWDRLKELQSNMADPSEKKAADSLVEFLAPILGPSVDSLSQTKRTGKVRFESVWQIFPPGEMVMTRFFDVETICRVLKYEYKVINRVPVWIITIEYVDWNGESCGYATTTARITYFEGFRRVKALPVYSLAFEEDEAEIKSRVVKRGRNFERLRGYHFLTCNGKKVLFETSEERPVSGRVVIDAFAYYRSRNAVKPNLRSLLDEAETPDVKDTVENDDSSTSSSSRTSSVLEGTEFKAKTMSENISRSEDLAPLTDEHCLLATPWLKGMDLKTKEWGQFLIDELKEIVWNDQAFDNLVLPHGEKELAWDFVESKNLPNNAYDDFIPDKGRGLIILMFGPPGVGKTYTAEAVAERCRVPLYLMSAGMLGTNPEDVEQSLDYALEICKLWNAMLLLDEADVFLGARTDDGLTRNELVSIFLTKLEYYQGILFLTTNRISSIDHAFQSRVDLFLPYYNLTDEARKQVWKNFINHVGSDRFDVSESDLDKLAKVNLNGREIKNLIKTSQLLSLKNRGKVTTERLYMLAKKRVQALELLDDHLNISKA